MERLTKDTPQENFETMLNFVFSQDGWAHIRHDGEKEDVALTEWARRECCRLDCELVPDDDPETIDEKICDCMQDYPDCIVAMAYLFASQASHLRDRLKAIEDILGDEYDLDHLRELAKAEKAGRLVVLDKPRKPLVWGDDAHDTVLCPNCNHDLMGGFPEGESCEMPMYQCPYCGQPIDDEKALTRQEAEAALKEERRNGKD